MDFFFQEITHKQFNFKFAFYLTKNTTPDMTTLFLLKQITPNKWHPQVPFPNWNETDIISNDGKNTDHRS